MEELPFPRDILDRLLAIAGNKLVTLDCLALCSLIVRSSSSKCCECQAYGPEWASISYGILLCLDCAGKHRSLGVQTSFVKSMYLDTWSIEQVWSQTSV
jgi:hypothetical protein